MEIEDITHLFIRMTKNISVTLTDLKKPVGFSLMADWFKMY